MNYHTYGAAFKFSEKIDVKIQKSTILKVNLGEKCHFIEPLIYLLILIGSSFCVGSEDQTGINNDHFFREIFTTGYLPDPALDPGGALTDAEIQVLKGEDLSRLLKESPIAYINYSWKRVEVTRVIGIRKLDRWIPELVEHIADISWPKSSIVPDEVSNPCVWALAQIGEPSVGPIIAGIAKSQNDGNRYLLNLALEGIKGKEGAALLLKERDIHLNRPIESTGRPDRKDSFPQKNIRSAMSEESNVAQDIDLQSRESVSFVDWRFFICILSAIFVVAACWKFKIKGQ